MDALIWKALLTGVITGAVFGALRLPIPAPQALAGVLGVLGIYLGFVAIQYFIGQ